MGADDTALTVRYDNKGNLLPPIGVGFALEEGVNAPVAAVHAHPWSFCRFLWPRDCTRALSSLAYSHFFTSLLQTRHPRTTTCYTRPPKPRFSLHLSLCLPFHIPPPATRAPSYPTSGNSCPLCCVCAKSLIRCWHLSMHAVEAGAPRCLWYIRIPLAQ